MISQLLIMDEHSYGWLPGAGADRLTHLVHIIEMTGDGYRLKHSKKRQSRAPATVQSATSTDPRRRRLADHEAG